MGHMISQVTVVGQRTEVTSMPETPDQYGDMIILNGAKVAVPQMIGKDNARMIVQPYVINNSKGKKVEMYRLPRVYDGAQYALTQERRMGYDIKHDSLFNFIVENEPLSAEKASYMWNDTIKLSNAQDNFQVLAPHADGGLYVLITNVCWNFLHVVRDVRYVFWNIRSTNMNWILRSTKKNRK